MKINVYSDPGHAWAKVKVELLEKLGIQDLISHCSYRRGNYAYLEEDCDLSTLIKALDKAKIDYWFVNHHTDRRSRIRNYTPFWC